MRLMRPGTIRTSVDLPKTLHRRLHEAAARKGCSARSLIVAAIEKAIEEGPQKPKGRLDLRRRSLVPRAGRTIDWTNEQLYEMGFP